MLIEVHFSLLPIWVVQVYKENKLLNNSTRYVHNFHKFYNIINKFVKQNMKEKNKKEGKKMKNQYQWKEAKNKIKK